MAKMRCARRTATQHGLLRSSRDLRIYRIYKTRHHLYYCRVGSLLLFRREQGVDRLQFYRHAVCSHCAQNVIKALQELLMRESVRCAGSIWPVLSGLKDMVRGSGLLSCLFLHDACGRDSVLLVLWHHWFTLGLASRGSVIE